MCSQQLKLQVRRGKVTLKVATRDCLGKDRNRSHNHLAVSSSVGLGNHNSVEVEEQMLFV